MPVGTVPALAQAHGSRVAPGDLWSGNGCRTPVTVAPAATEGLPLEGQPCESRRTRAGHPAPTPEGRASPDGPTPAPTGLPVRRLARGPCGLVRHRDAVSSVLGAWAHGVRPLGGPWVQTPAARPLVLLHGLRGWLPVSSCGPPGLLRKARRGPRSLRLPASLSLWIQQGRCHLALGPRSRFVHAWMFILLRSFLVLTFVHQHLVVWDGGLVAVGHHTWETWGACWGAGRGRPSPCPRDWNPSPRPDSAPGWQLPPLADLTAV